jgi:hypothetical protein
MITVIHTTIILIKHKQIKKFTKTQTNKIKK